jgi:CheY-like chemotaxis protein
MIANRLQAEADQQPQVMPPPPSKVLSILVAEDEPLNQKFIRLFLERFGHIVTLASDGYQAYTLWEQGDYDLILMDIQMPGMRGDEVVRKIRQQEQERHIPIIAVTGNCLSKDRNYLLEAGCDGYVAKPFQFKELIAEIEQVV